MLDCEVAEGCTALLVAPAGVEGALKEWQAAQRGTVEVVTAADLGVRAEASVDAVVASIDSSVPDLDSVVASAANVLRPDAPLVLLGPEADHDKLSLAVMMAGLVERGSAKLGGEVHLQAVKPGFQAGAAAKLPVAAPASKGAAVWKLMADGDDDADLEDEDALLDGDIVKPKAAGEACAPTRKPCANCTCGRADAEATQRKADAVAAAATVGSSGCGSCGKGDAFRCASCPFLGKPPFKAGEAPVLDTDVVDA